MKAARNRKQPPPLKSKGKWKLPSQCPGCDKCGTFLEKDVEAIHEIRGEEILCHVPKYVCSECKCTFMSQDQATIGVKIAVTAYQIKHDLLTATDVASQRKALNLSIVELSEKANVGEATIKRLEAGGYLVNPGISMLLKHFFDSEITEFEPISTIDEECSEMDSCVTDLKYWSEETPAFLLGFLENDWTLESLLIEPDIEVAA